VRISRPAEEILSSDERLSSTDVVVVVRLPPYEDEVVWERQVACDVTDDCCWV
jgi:hypothetical protein